MCHYAVLFCSLAVLDPRVGHTMDALPYEILVTQEAELLQKDCMTHCQLTSCQPLQNCTKNPFEKHR